MRQLRQTVVNDDLHAARVDDAVAAEESKKRPKPMLNTAFTSTSTFSGKALTLAHVLRLRSGLMPMPARSVMNRSARSTRTRLPCPSSLLTGNDAMTLSLYDTLTESACGEPSSA